MDGEFKRKKRMTSIVVIIYLFLTGFEASIVFPALWAYLQSLGITQEYWFGFTIAAYSLSMGLAGVIGGRLADIYLHQTKSIVIISILIMAFGNLQYTVGINITNIIIARLICGVGTAAQSAMTAELCRVTEVEERTPILATCNAAKQVGLFVAPAFQLIFSHFHFNVFGLIEVNPLNAPGAFMAAVWIVFCVLALVMFHNLTAELQKIQNAALKVAPKERSEQLRLGADLPEPWSTSSTSDYGTVHDEDKCNKDEEQRLSLDGARNCSVADISSSESLTKRRTVDKATWGLYLEEFLTDTFILLQSMMFTLCFCVRVVWTMLPVVLQEYFDYGVIEISLLFVAAGLAGLFVYSTVAFTSKFIRDSTLQLIGWFLFTASHVWLIVVLRLCEREKPVHIGFLVSGAMLMFFAYPIAQMGNTGLTAKVLTDKTQGMGQGVRRLLGCVGLIYGPLWAGSTVEHPIWLMAVPLGILLLNGIMLAKSFTSLREVEDKSHRESLVPGATETEPLLCKESQ